MEGLWKSFDSQLVAALPFKKCPRDNFLGRILSCGPFRFLSALQNVSRDISALDLHEEICFTENAV